MPAKKKPAKQSASTKSSAKMKDIKPKKNPKGGRYDIVGAFPKKLEFGQ